jgi:hypothetical protein
MYVHKTVRSQNHAMELVNEKFKEAGLWPPGKNG